jgi:rhodanese-related sulfurtransferase
MGNITETDNNGNNTFILGGRMPIPKLLKSELATAHILGTKSQKQAIHGIAKRENKRVSKLLAKMINNYIDDNYGKEHPIYKSYYRSAVASAYVKNYGGTGPPSLGAMAGQGGKNEN